MEDLLELLGRPPVGGVVRRAAVEVSFLEVEVAFLADTAELRILRVEALKSGSEGFLVPAPDDEHALWSSALEHLSEAFFSNAVRQDAEGVHAHAGESEGVVGPELVVGVVSFFLDYVIEFERVSLQELDVGVCISEFRVQSVGKVDHRLAEFDSNKHVEVSIDFREQLGCSHANLDDRGGIELARFRNAVCNRFEKLDFLCEKLSHAIVSGLLGVDAISPDSWGKVFPHSLNVSLVVALFIFVLKLLRFVSGLFNDLRDLGKLGFDVHIFSVCFNYYNWCYIVFLLNISFLIQIIY